MKTNRTELFNLTDDPGEMNDLSAQFPEKTMDLNQILLDKLKDTNAKFAADNPDYIMEIIKP